ncbi:hypothetical protein HZS_1300 [Henneguya salminicola]|nr:hypothetical protein HZS_1300 [Henneguya salminicola]
MLDSNKLTQGSAISCFLNLSESCGNKLSQYTDIICQKILVCMSVYKSNVLKQLYDSLGPFAKYLPGFSTNNIFTTQILPIMIYRIAVEKREFTICDLALIDSISYLSFFFKERFLPFTENLICFCVSTIEQGINQIIASEQDPSIDGPDTDYIAACLDLLASLVEHVGFPIKQLLIKYNVSNVLGRSCMCSEKDIRISVFLVIGLVAQLFIDVLQPNIDTFITLLLDFKESDSVDVISNSFWAIKYFIQKLGPESSKYIPYFMDHVFLLLSSLQLNKQTLENLGMTFPFHIISV